ncbi:hypothetical protein CWB41_11335 [Methylovirgula ligni]|jgi:hypothetical protein|uniref:Uncharacterized protein DUF1656 n=1 Tax=Methylovirgula ligni TaxID=569860 RepID=A0A3D9YTW3_9HYPH|nr:DUF1656 domain-containing protein [Methylovirgula ligni]QAY96246.1 hypothetical protein CWB41_11335 [Methylovirgula ligni]REF86047.1 uncharacterized protein DUF1656 [Methylovirgula ligni]
MSGEFDIIGVFIPTLGIWMLIAFALTAMLRRILAACHFYNLVWHRALFDLALYVVTLGLVVFIAQEFTT